MGKGKGRDLKSYLDPILRIVALVFSIAALTIILLKGGMLFSGIPSIDALNIPASTYIIILGVMLILKFVKGVELVTQFEGVISAIGAALLIGSGIAECVINGGGQRGLISGILGICGGAALGLDALKCFGIF